MSYDGQKFSDLQELIKRKLSDFKMHQEPKVFEGQSLGGKVSVKVILSNFVEYKVQEVKIDPSLMQEQAFMIEDLIKAAFDDAFRKSLENNKDFLNSLMSFYF